MASSVYFNNFQSSQEQILIENLIIESIKIYGHDVYYLPRTIKNKDEIYGTDTISEYNNAYFFELYIRSYDSYQGDGTFLSKFNLEIRDQITFTVALRTFDDEVGMYASIERPREGDLIFSTMMKRLFVIKYVNFRPVFYQLGALQMYDLVCEVFEYSSERFNTGVEEIDAIEEKYTTSMDNFSLYTQDDDNLTDQDGYNLIQEEYQLDKQSQDVFADNDEIQAEAAQILDWSQIDPFSEGKI